MVCLVEIKRPLFALWWVYLSFHDTSLVYSICPPSYRENTGSSLQTIFSTCALYSQGQFDKMDSFSWNTEHWKGHWLWSQTRLPVFLVSVIVIVIQTHECFISLATPPRSSKHFMFSCGWQVRADFGCWHLR